MVDQVAEGHRVFTRLEINGVSQGAPLAAMNLVAFDDAGQICEEWGLADAGLPKTADAPAQEKSQAFLAKMMDVISAAAVSQAMALGDRLGLFSVMSSLPPSTSAEIAASGGVQERYLREWLAVVVTGGLVEYDAIAKSYWLPPEHASWLVPGFWNMASGARMLSLAAIPEDKLVECFRHGGGVPYAEFGPFMEYMGEMRRPQLENAVIPILRQLPEVAARLENGIDVADIGCGNGHAINVLAREFPRSRFTGIDILPESLARARAETANWGLNNAAFEQQDAGELTGSNRFDVVFVLDAMHDQAPPRKVARAIHELLRPSGWFLCQDIASSGDLEEDRKNPINAWLYIQSLYHCMTVSLSAGGEGLGAMWGECEARKVFGEAGFSDVQLRAFAEDSGQAWYICRK